MELLFVRWFGRDVSFSAGWSAKRLHRLGFLRGAAAFGFVDPDVVIRGVHLIPAFDHGHTDDLLPESFVRREADSNLDWVYFYVNM
jgi:hypothetical protein